MRTLFLAPQPFFRERGSPIRALRQLEVLSRLGHEADVLCYPFGEDIALPGIRIIRTWRPPGLKDVKVGPSPAKFPLDLALLLRAVRLCRRRRYAVIQAVEEAPDYIGAGWGQGQYAGLYQGCHVADHDKYHYRTSPGISPLTSSTMVPSACCPSLTSAEERLLSRISRGQPQLHTLRSIMDEVYRLFDRRCRMETALDKLARLRRRVRRFRKVGKTLQKLFSPNLEKALTFLDDSLLPSTSNAVERGNRRHRKMQKTVYRVRTQANVRARIALDMQRDSQAQNRALTVRTLHSERLRAA